MAEIQQYYQKINQYLDDIIDASKTRSIKLYEEKTLLKILIKDINSFKKQIKANKKNKTKVHHKQIVGEDIYKFMGLNYIIKVSKSDVMQFICNYVKEKGLQNPEDKRKFFTNKELSKLFGVKYKTQLSTIEIMKYIHPYFNI